MRSNAPSDSTISAANPHLVDHSMNGLLTSFALPHATAWREPVSLGGFIHSLTKQQAIVGANEKINGHDWDV